MQLTSIRKRLKAVIVEQMNAENIPGLALALTDRAQTLWVTTHGYADLATKKPVAEDTRFAIGSIGKSFTSIALLQEQEAGQLELDQSVTRYLPWFKVGSRHEPITIHHLLSHTSGLLSAFDIATSDWQHVFALREIEVIAPPGERFYYSNDGYQTLGLVLRAITGRSYGEVILSRILEPLGMHHSDPAITNATRKHLAVGHQPFYDDRPTRRDEPLVAANWFETDTADGCLACSAGDLAIYLRMLLNRGRGSRDLILSEASFAKMSSRVIGVDDWWYGYGLASKVEDGHTIIGHNGGMPAFVSAMTGDVGAGVGVVVLANAAADLYPIAEYARRLLRAAVNGGPVPEAPRVSDPTLVENASDYEGSYVGEAFSFELRAQDKQLLMRWKGEDIILEPRGSDAFLVPHDDFALFLLRFERQAEKVIAASYGATCYVNSHHKETWTTSPAPETWSTYAGHYRSFTPWVSNFRIIVRRGSMFFVFPEGWEAPLTPIGDARFKLGDNGVIRFGSGDSGEIRFGSIVDGLALEATLVTAKYYRVHTP
jgi:D-alanyl-D-alanine carboxypeptidase